MKPRFLLLTRPECHLCESFEQALREHAGDAIELEHADVDSRPDWQRRYGLKIPVLLAADGSVVCETVFDPSALAGVMQA